VRVFDRVEVLMKRPFGVFIIGILALLGALFNILAGLGAVGVEGLDFFAKVLEEGKVLGADTKTVGIVLIVIGVLYLIFALSFLRLHGWAYVALFIVQVLGIAAAVARFVMDGWHWSALVTAVIPVLIVLYLLMPKVRTAFFKK
jgi:hypothetical protein